MRPLVTHIHKNIGKLVVQSCSSHPVRSFGHFVATIASKEILDYDLLRQPPHPWSTLGPEWQRKPLGHTMSRCSKYAAGCCSSIWMHSSLIANQTLLPMLWLGISLKHKVSFWTHNFSAMLFSPLTDDASSSVSFLSQLPLSVLSVKMTQHKWNELCKLPKACLCSE